MAVEPAYDIANPSNARQSMLAAEFVVMLSAFENESMYDYCNVILPMASFAETSGTYINIDKKWQTVKGVMQPHGESRPAWKILRVLGNLFQVMEFDYTSSEEVLNEVKTNLNMSSERDYEMFYPETLPNVNEQLVRMGEWPLYRVDQTVRHAQELQNCAASEAACVRINPETAKRLKLDDVATVSQGDIEITLPLKRDERIVPDVIWVANALPETADLGHSFAGITIKR